MTVRILVGDCRDVLRTLPAESVQCVVTSPPYFGLRDYGTPPQVWGGDPNCQHEWGDTIPGDPRGGSGPNAKECYGGQDGATNYARHVTRGNYCLHCGAWSGSIGLEPTPAEYVSNLVAVFREVRRVLRTDGTVWLNLGDSYAGAGDRPNGGKGNEHGQQKTHKTPDAAIGLKPKDLIGIPWMVAFALRDDGWWLRSDIVWSKPNPMPESVIDRPTKAHEYIFLLTKAARYFWDAEAVREDSTPDMQRRAIAGHTRGGNGKLDASRCDHDTLRGEQTKEITAAGRNIRSVWTIATHPYSEAHFATFPPDIPERCIKAGTSERGCCPQCGAPWVRVVERQGVSTYERIKQEQRITHWDMKAESSKRGSALKCGAEGLGSTRNANGTTPHFDSVPTATTGWRPSCECGSDPVPCVILDPFAGAGTTLLVADRLQRDAIGIELNAEYAVMAERRIATDAGPMCADVVVQNHNQLEMTL